MDKKKQAAAEGLGQGLSLAECAARSGISEERLRIYLEKDEAFVRQMARSAARQSEQVRRKADAYAMRALEVMAELMEEGTPSVRYQVARTLLARVMAGTQDENSAGVQVVFDGMPKPRAVCGGEEEEAQED